MQMNILIPYSYKTQKKTILHKSSLETSQSFINIWKIINSIFKIINHVHAHMHNSLEIDKGKKNVIRKHYPVPNANSWGIRKKNANKQNPHRNINQLLKRNSTWSSADKTTTWRPWSRSEVSILEKLPSATWATRSISSNLENPSFKIPEPSLYLVPSVLSSKSLLKNRLSRPWLTECGIGHMFNLSTLTPSIASTAWTNNNTTNNTHTIFPIIKNLCQRS